MQITNLPAEVSFTQKNKTTCRKSKYNKFSSLQEAKTKCGEDSGCHGVYDARCDGKRWYLCPYGSTSVSSSSCVYIKEGKVRKIHWKISTIQSKYNNFVNIYLMCLFIKIYKISSLLFFYFIYFYVACRDTVNLVCGRTCSALAKSNCNAKCHGTPVKDLCRYSCGNCGRYILYLY